MQHLKYLIVFLLVTGNLFSQKPSLHKGKISQKNYYEEIDFLLENDKIVLPVTINGKTYRFLLDTGAPNLISKRVLNELNIPITNSMQAHDSNNQSSPIETAVIPSMQMGALTFGDNLVLVTDLDNHFILKCYKYDGFIGSNSFRNSILKISLKDHKITITDNIKKLQLQSKPTKLKLIGEQQSPYIKINFSGKLTEEVLVDTGMDGFYEISNRAYGIFSGENIFTVLSKSNGSGSIGLFGTAPVKEQALLKFPALTVNDTRFENLITNTTDDNNSRLGLDLLKHGDLVIDFKNKKFYFEGNPKVVFDKKPPIYSSTLIDNKFSIGFVWDTHYRDRLNYGDEIVRIGPYRINEMDFCESIIELKKFRKNNTSYEMEVKTKDSQTLLLNIENQ